MSRSIVWILGIIVITGKKSKHYTLHGATLWCVKKVRGSQLKEYLPESKKKNVCWIFKKYTLLLVHLRLLLFFRTFFLVSSLVGWVVSPLLYIKIVFEKKKLLVLCIV